MRKPLRRAVWVCIPLSLSVFIGCGGENGPGEAGWPSDQGAPAGPPGGGASAPGLKQIMTRLAKGPSSLTPVLGQELKADMPAWETIQAQAKEFATLATEMSKYDPPKGSKESWIKLTGEYADSADDLDKAAQAKNKDSALAAHGELANSCMACHREHRMMGPGRGGQPGGFPGGPPGGRGGPPPGGRGGPPPSGPGGPPPGGPGGPPPDGAGGPPPG
jgi:cytochrome c556